MSALQNLSLVLSALLLVLLNAFFVAAEFAIVKLRHTKVEELRRMHGLRGRILATVHRQLDAYLSACQLGITLASLGLGWIGEPAFAALLETPLAALGLDRNPETEQSIAFVLAFATISYLHIVVGELAPKSVALRKPEAVSLWTAAPLYLFYWTMFPFIWVLNASANWTLRRAGLEAAGAHGDETPYSHDELRMIVHLSRAGVDDASSELNRMLAHTLDLSELQASDVMRSRRELITLTSDDSHADVRRTLQIYRYSRYPYVDAVTGTVLGVLLLKDLYLLGPGADFRERLQAQLRPIQCFAEQAPVAELLRSFRLGAPHLALVQDFDGSMVGFVTMEDILEAVFGEITDEHERERLTQINREPQWLEDGSLLVRGDTPLYRLERETGEAIPESAAVSTVTGLLMRRLGQMPEVGVCADIGGWTACVMKARGTAVEAVRLVRRAAS
ncbi:MAG: corC1 [Nevskia sp.]|nr:corC1 [Nevskia sp.]